MKKVLCSVLVLLLTLSLCGCGNFLKLLNDLNDLQEAIEAHEKDDEVSRGKWEGNVYTNDFVGLSYTKDGEWQVKSDEEIAEMVGYTIDMVYDDNGNIMSDYIKKSSVYDTMVAQNNAPDDNFSDNLIVMYEFALLPGSGSEVEMAFTEKVIKGLQGGYDQYKAFSDIVHVEICGNTYCSFVCVGQVGEIGYAQQYAIRKEGSYMVSVIASANDYDALCDIFDNFESYQRGELDEAVENIEFTIDDADNTENIPTSYETGWDGNVYTNANGDVVFNMPEGWQIANSVDPSMGFEVDSKDGTCNVQLMVEDVGVSDIPSQLFMDSIIDQLGSGYDESGASYDIGETETVTIGGDEFVAVGVDVSLSGVDMKQYIAVRSVDQYFVYIIITDVNDNVDDVLACFQ